MTPKIVAIGFRLTLAKLTSPHIIRSGSIVMMEGTIAAIAPSRIAVIRRPRQGAKLSERRHVLTR
ncbi:MAG TPA: hypothetical protein VGG06_05935 [Thermoanaerobaculia bacterium]